MVARQAEVSVGRVQHCFPSKEQLLAPAFDGSNALTPNASA